jgi:hypothetical protein
MAGTGGFRKGAGRKSNASKLMEAGFVANWFTAEFQRIKWESLVNSKDERVSLDAMKYLSDRLFGKPHQAVDLNHSGEIDLRRAERIRRARERSPSLTDQYARSC